MENQVMERQAWVLEGPGGMVANIVVLDSL